MTTKDKRILQKMLEGCARVQARNDKMYFRVSGADKEAAKEVQRAIDKEETKIESGRADKKEWPNTILTKETRNGVITNMTAKRANPVKDMVVALHNDKPSNDKERRTKKASDHKEVVKAAAKDVLKTYGAKEAADVVVQRTGASDAEAKAALTVARQEGATAKDIPTYRVDPQFNWEERVQRLVAKGTARKDAEAAIDRVIETKELTAIKMAPANKEAPLSALALGQHFSEVTAETVAAQKAGFKPSMRSGYVVHSGKTSVIIMRERDLPAERTFTTAQGKTVTFRGSKMERLHMAPDVVVTALSGREDIALLLQQNEVSSGSASIQDQMEDVMKKGNKKAAKKAANGKANGHAGRGPAFGDDASVKLLKGPADDSIKRHVTILSTLKELGGKTTVAALAKAFAKASNTKQDAGKVLRMHTKALTDGGFISITPASA